MKLLYIIISIVLCIGIVGAVGINNPYIPNVSPTISGGNTYTNITYNNITNNVNLFDQSLNTTDYVTFASVLATTSMETPVIYSTGATIDVANGILKPQDSSDSIDWNFRNLIAAGVPVLHWAGDSVESYMPFSAPNLCYSDGTNCSTYNSTYAGLIGNSSYLNNLTNVAMLNNTAQVFNNGITVKNLTAADSNVARFFVMNDVLFSGGTATYITPTFNNGRFYLGSPDKKIVDLNLIYTTNMINVPVKLLQVTAVNPSSFCLGRTCSVIGNEGGDVVVSSSAGSYITPAHGTNAAAYQSLAFRSYVNDSSTAPYLIKGSGFVFDMNATSTTGSTLNHSTWTTNVGSTSVMTLDINGNLWTLGNITAKTLKAQDMNVTGNVFIGGNLSVKRPYGMFSSNVTQTLAVANTPYPVTFNNIEDNYQVYKASDNANFSFGETGDYLIELSAVFSTAIPNSHPEIWVQKNGRNVVRSNTRTHLSNANAEQVVAVPFILDMNMTDSMRIMWAGDDNGITMTYTTNTSYSPETPSIIMTITKISELT